MRPNSSVFRRFVARSLVVVCAGIVPIVAGAALGTPAAYAKSSGHDATVFAFGTAPFHGSTQGMHLNAPIVGMASTPNGKGYWLVANDGGVFGFNAPFFGSLGAMHLNKPIIGMAATPSGRGYWLVAQDGGVFTFGDAHFYGSMGATRLNAPVIGMTATPKGKGYLLVASDGGVFTFGDAKFKGSTGSRHVAAPVVGLAGTSTGKGYWLALSNGQVFNFGDAKNAGNALHTLPATRRITQITSVPGTGGYRLFAQAKPFVLGPPIGVGSSGAAVVGLQQRLLSLGYWLPGVTGSYDSLTEQAVYAFQKYERLPRTGSVDLVTRFRLRDASRPVPRTTSGYTIEIDKTRQILIVASGGQAAWVFNASSGSDIPYTSQGARYTAHTPEGHFNFQRQVDGYDKSPLGQLYRPKYFTSTGIAVHGYTDVPPYPASHGCIRVSNTAMDYMWANNILPLGAAVWVYV